MKKLGWTTYGRQREPSKEDLPAHQVSGQRSLPSYSSSPTGRGPHPRSQYLVSLVPKRPSLLALGMLL